MLVNMTRTERYTKLSSDSGGIKRFVRVAPKQKNGGQQKGTDEKQG